MKKALSIVLLVAIMVCVFAPLFRQPFSGKEVRAQAGDR